MNVLPRRPEALASSAHRPVVPNRIATSAALHHRVTVRRALVVVIRGVYMGTMLTK